MSNKSEECKQEVIDQTNKVLKELRELSILLDRNEGVVKAQSLYVATYESKEKIIRELNNLKDQ